MTINVMSIDKFAELREIGNKEKITFSSMVILPTGEVHDSCYCCMMFVAVDEADEPICRFGGDSDVIQLDGPCARGINHEQNSSLHNIRPKPWCIDYLGKSGLMRIYAPGYKLTFSRIDETFALFAVK